MPRITVLPHPDYAPDGASIDTHESVTICDALLDHAIEIEHACGKVGACTTCHVIVTQGADSLTLPDDNEEDMLDRAWGLETRSRLSCQAVIGDADITVRIPQYSINHAKENG